MNKMKDLEGIGFTIVPEQSIAYGSIGAYKFMMDFLAQQNQYSAVTAVKPKDSEHDTLGAYLETFDKERYDFINWIRYNDHVISMNFNNKKLTVENLKQFLKELTNYLMTNAYTPCCHHCHEEKPLNVYTMNGEIDILCRDCFLNIAEATQELKPVNLPLGIVGALLGSCIGVAVWVIIYKLGFIAGITGFIMAVCSFKGYEILGGRIDKKGIWISLAVSIIMLAMTEYISLGLEIHSAFSEYYSITIFDAIRSVPDFLSESDVMAEVVKDLLYGYVFMAVASYSYIKAIHHKAKHAGVCEQLDQ